MFDPLVTLSYLAANTSKIALGTCVIDMLFHNPVVLARRFATLDLLSEGRIISGLGIGWSKDEYQASNVQFKERGKRADEFLQALKMIWTDDIVEFKHTLESLDNSITNLKNIAKKANKNPNNFNVILLVYPNIIDSSNKSSKGPRFPLTGTIEQALEDMQKIKQMGVEHIIFGYNFIPSGKDPDRIVELTKELTRPLR